MVQTLNRCQSMSKPRISINKLGEYITATATRRKSIVQDQKKPMSYVTPRYDEAKRAYANYFVSGFDPTGILDLKSTLEKKQFIHKTTFKENDRVTSIDALSLYDQLTLPTFDGLTFELNTGGKLDIAGVDVSVNPNVICRGLWKGENVVGALKLHVAKGSLTVAAQEIVATILHQYIEEKILTDGQIAPLELAMSLDIFSKRLTTAPKAIKRRRIDIQAACEEYALRWEKL